MRALRVATLEECAHYGGRLPRGLIAPIAGASGPALVNGLGAVENGTSPASFTCAHAAAAGSVVIAAAAAETSGSATVSVSDSASNPYTTAVDSGATADPAHIAYSQLVSGLTTSSTIAAPASVGSGSLTQLGAAAGVFSGIKLAPYAGATASGFNSNATVTSGSVNAGDLALFLVCISASAVATPAGWSVVSVDPSSEVGMFYQVPAAAGPLSPSITTSFTTWTAAIVAFPALALPPGSHTNWSAVRRSMYR